VKALSQTTTTPGRCCVRLVHLASLLLITGCASSPVSVSWMQVQTVALRDRLVQLDAAVDADEASRLAETAVEQSAALAREFRAVRPAWLGNYMVNLGLRDRGLCYNWANGLYPRLHALDLRTLDIHLGVARMDTKREHNCIVVTARQQPFADGIVLDAWRHSGRLWFGIAATDKYPWQPLPRNRLPPELESLVAP
jgi:hypothetical protein